MNEVTNNYQIKWFSIGLAAVSPFLLLMAYGYMPSISQYWRTDLQPLFIITNAMTSYHLFSVKTWQPSAILLLLLTAFSVDLYGGLHNVLAILFFIVTLYPLFKSNHFKFCRWIYLTSLIALPFSMTVAEIIAIEALCLYHGLVLYKFHQLKK